MSLSPEKRTEILQLLADGKITADEAAELLTDAPTIEEPSPPPAALVPEPVKEKAVNGSKPKWLHVEVSDSNTGKSKVKVRVPLRMVKFGLSMGKRFAPELKEFDLDELSKAMTEDAGVLVDVQDEEDGEHVQIYVA